MIRMLVKSMVFFVLLSLAFRICCHAGELQSTVCRPVKIAVLQDLTGSIQDNDVPVIQMSDVDALIKMISRCGGELGVGSISENSNRRLARLVLGAPPAQPPAPSKKGNPYKAARLQTEYKEQTARYQALHAQWSRSNAANMERFREEVLKVMDRKQAKSSDIWSAVRRADLFLSENSGVWGGKLIMYAVFITDGVDNAGRKAVRDVNKNVQYIAVPGQTGVLTDLNPMKFESVPSAFRYINSSIMERSK